MTDDPLAAFRGRFTVLAPDITTDGYYGGIRYGLENESSRLNLNTVLLADSSKKDGARKMLMTLPGMTEPIADAILDWIDPDDEPRMLGAEREYYSALDAGLRAAQRPARLDRRAAAGARRHARAAVRRRSESQRRRRRQRAEPAERSTTSTTRPASSNRGWAAYLTLDSAETNVKADGTPKIDVNMDDLEELHKQLIEVLDDDMANFIIAYRQGGAYDGEEAGQPASSLTIDFKQQGRVRLNTILDLIGVKTRIAKPTQPGQPSGQGNGGGEWRRQWRRSVAAGGGGGWRRRRWQSEQQQPHRRRAGVSQRSRRHAHLSAEADGKPGRQRRANDPRPAQYQPGAATAAGRHSRPRTQRRSTRSSPTATSSSATAARAGVRNLAAHRRHRRARRR